MVVVSLPSPVGMEVFSLNRLVFLYDRPADYRGRQRGRPTEGRQWRRSLEGASKEP